MYPTVHGAALGPPEAAIELEHGGVGSDGSAILYRHASTALQAILVAVGFWV